MRYVALLRGINVGGNNKIAMAELRLCFEQGGYGNVRTYIQSGNVLFDTPEADPLKLARTLEKAITKQFNLNVDVAVVSQIRMAEIIAKAPEWWGKDPSWKHNLIVLLDPAERDSIVEAIGVLKPGIEAVEPGPGVIYQSMSFDQFGKTTTGKLASNPVYKRLTIRNYNTAHKLCTLLETA